jgi:DNA polymerase
MSAPKPIVVVDLETYYDKEYSLSKMTTEEYVNDERFQIIGMSIKIGNMPALWASYPTLQQYANVLMKLKDCAFVAHNALFDGAIIEWKLGVHPLFWFDTLSMARPKHNSNAGGSLAKLAVHYQIGEKGNEVVQAMGKRREDFIQEDLDLYGEYCKNDVELTYKLFKELSQGYPTSELKLIDQTLRMYLRPQLMLDIAMIDKEIGLEVIRRDNLMAKLGDVTAKDLGSGVKFAALLEKLGVDVPMKPSPKDPDKLIYAFAKSDADFMELLESDNEEIAALCEARLGVKSTQRMTRANRFKGIYYRMEGYLPIPLGYYNAHTGRYGGLEKINLQNLQRTSRKDENAGLLRKAIIAPEGKKLAVADLSQIEARLLAWQAGQQDKVEAFRQKRDVYSEQASAIYGRKVDRKKNEEDFVPGFIGKATVLGCGFGLGAPKFSGMIYVGMLGEAGIQFDQDFADTLQVDVEAFKYRVHNNADMTERYLSKYPTKLTEDEWLTHCAVGTKIITVFRESNPQIVAYWKVEQYALAMMLEGERFEFGGPNNNLLFTEKNAIVLPNGMRLLYHGLERDDEGSFSFLRRKEGRIQRVRTYGGSIVENITQALARIVVTDNMAACERLGLPTVLQVHDEIVTLTDEDYAEIALEKMINVMRVPPVWAPGLPLDAEGGTGYRYGDAK